jgi:Flp pilus assembly protein TadG
MSNKESVTQSLPKEPRPAQSRRKRRGSALVELSLLSPWVLFLFVGILDLGFYTYSLISIENAARIGAQYTSTSSTTAADQSGACAKILLELASLPNVANLSSCSASPLTVTASSVTGPDGSPASSVSVTYRSISLIPIPGLLQSQLNVTRIVKMRLRS